MSTGRRPPSNRPRSPDDQFRHRGGGSEQPGYVYPVQTLYGGGGYGSASTPSPPPKAPRKVTDDDDQISTRVYDAPPPVATSGYGRAGSTKSHRRVHSGSGQGEETTPLIGAAPALTRSGSGGRGGDEWIQSNPPPGILREPHRSRGFSSDGPLLGGLPPISPAKPTSTGGPQVYDAAAGGFGSGTPRDEMIAAHDRLQHRPIRSSGIGATQKQTKHRRARSATDGPVTSLLLKEDYSGGSSGGYGAIMTDQTISKRRHSFQKLATFGGEAFSSPQAANKRPSYRRSSTDIPPTRRRSSRRSPSPDTRLSFSGIGSTGMRSRTNSAEGPAVTFESDNREASPLPPRPRARTGSVEGQCVTFESDSPPASPLPPRPRGRTSSTENAARDPFAGSGSYMTPLDGVMPKPGHRRVDSTQSAASLSSAFSFVSDMSVTSYVSDISKSRLFRGVTETGDVQLHLPIDNVRLTMDSDLEAGTLYKQKDDDEIERYEDYHLLCTDPTAQDLRGFDLDDGLACTCDCMNCNLCTSKRGALPDVRYVLNVDPDLYKRVLSEIADSRSYPCGLYYCGHHEDVDTPSIWIAVFIVVIFFLGMAAVTIWWQ